MATNSTITITINAQNNATSTINSVNAALGGISTSGNSAINVMGGLRTAVLGVTAVLGGLAAAGIGVLASATNQAAEFEQALANVKAATGATADQMAAMRKEALGIGKDTSKSAKEAVDAMGELAKAGMNVEDITAGVARAVVNLSEATDYSMTESAILVSNAVNTFKESGLTAQDASELMAKASNASAISMGDLAYSIQNAGGVSSAAKIQFKDLMIMTGILGNNGIKGADGATALKTAILALSAPSKDAAGALMAMGVSMYDATESFRPMKDVIGDLHVVMADMTDAQIMENLKDVFGTDAIRGMIPLIRAGTEGWDEFADAMDKAPSIAEQSATRLATFQGKIDAFKGSVETASIVVGEAFLPLLGRIADAANRAFNAVDWEMVGQGLGAVIELLTEGDPEKRIVQFERLSEALGNPRAAEQVALLTSGIIGLYGILTGAADGLERVRSAIEGLFGPDAAAAFDQIVAAFNYVRDAVVSLWNYIQPAVIAVRDFVGQFVTGQDVLMAVAIIVASVVVPAVLAVTAAVATAAALFAAFVVTIGALRQAFDLMQAKWLEYFGHVQSTVKQAEKDIATIKAAFEGLVNFLTNLRPPNPFQALVDTANQAKALLSGGGGAQPSTTVAVEARAEGGGIDAGMPYLVGEQGPELIIPHAAGTVLPSDVTSGLASRIGLDINLNVAGTVGDEQQMTAIEQIVAQVIASLQSEFKRMALGAAL